MGSTPNKKYSILIVDDEAGILESLSACLTDFNAVIKTFNSPDEACDWGKENCFDLLITDLKMSGMTGIELHQKLKIYYPDLITILMTAYASLDSAQEAVEANIYAYVNKPFSLTEINNLVQRALEKKDLLDRNRELVDTQQQLIEKLLVANKELKQLDRMKSDFVSVVSHELRTPITSLKNILYNLEHGVTGDLNEKQNDYVRMMAQDTGRLERLIDDILDLSQLESGKYFLKPSEFKLSSLIDGVVENMSTIASSKNIQIFKEMDESNKDLILFADKGKVEQVFTNLIGNAINYSEFGKRVWVGFENRGDLVVLFVRDEGIGVPDDAKKRIFSMFDRGLEGGKSSVKGTGLGLAIVKKIMDLHSGSINVESEVGKGSIFKAELPIRQTQD